jgi:hypothetical protein
MSISKKTKVFEILYEQVSGRSRPWTVTNEEVAAAIAERNKSLARNKPLSKNNPANFLKDFIRKPTCNANWPEKLKTARITARQRYGSKQVLEFVPYEDEDTVPFPDRFEPTSDMRVVEVESLSIPGAARELGRKDEAWLIQIIVNQRIAHTHFATVSSLSVHEFTHLQMSVKTQPEIDAVFMATINEAGGSLRALVTCEAKQIGERLLENQIREQVQQAFQFTAPSIETVAIDAIIPVGIRVIDHDVDGNLVRGIYFVEFGMIKRVDFNDSYAGDGLYRMPLMLRSRAFYTMKPRVAGVS